MANLIKRVGASVTLGLIVVAVVTLSVVPSDCLALSPLVAKAQAIKCPDLVQQALALSRDECIGIGRNKACYGHSLVSAQAQAGTTNFAFATQGDVANVESIHSLTLNPYDQQTVTWGIVYLRVQASLPNTAVGENVTIMMFGQTQIDDGANSADVQSAYPYLANLQPYQAFYFRSNMLDSDLCEQMPGSGVIVQTPAGTGEARLVANEVQFDLTGGTIFMTARPGHGADYSVIEGSARVTADGVTQLLAAGTQLTVPMTDDLKPSGPPGPPRPYQATHMPGVAAQYLPEPVSVAPPQQNAVCQIAQKGLSS